MGPDFEPFLERHARPVSVRTPESFRVWVQYWVQYARWSCMHGRNMPRDGAIVLSVVTCIAHDRQKTKSAR
jgi:hypothetical protein